MVAKFLIRNVSFRFNGDVALGQPDLGHLWAFPRRQEHFAALP
jgi:hypothetical protein